MDIISRIRRFTCRSHTNVALTCSMLTSSNEKVFRVTGPLCREFTGHRWIPLTKASDLRLKKSTGGELRNGVNGFLTSLRNRFCTIFATDSWQRTRGHDEGVHKMTNIIHNYRFVKPYIIHNITLCIKILDASLQGCWGMYNKDSMLVWTNVCFLCRYASFSVPQTLRLANCLLINSSSYVYLCRCSPRL